MRVVIRKRERKLYLLDGDAVLLCAAVGLGRIPEGKKRREGDGRTPEGVYRICLVKPEGKFGRSMGLSYPNLADADAGLCDGVIGPEAKQAIADALDQQRRPPWGTALGGEIYIHEGGAHADWTQGCIALDSPDMDVLYPCWAQIAQVEICP